MISKKIIKRSLVGVGSALTLTVAISFAVNAMGNKKEKIEPVKAEFVEWHYNGTSSDSPTDASKYTLSAGEPCLTPQQTVCMLFAPPSPSNSAEPDMTATVTRPGQPNRTVAQRITDAVGGSTKITNETVLSLKPL